MQKEYWVNVYNHVYYNLGGYPLYVHDSKDRAIKAAMSGLKYRIHVKMKNVKPKYEYGKIHESWFLY